MQTTFFMSKVLIHCEAHCQKYENLNNYNSKKIKDILKIPTNLSSVSGTKKLANTVKKAKIKKSYILVSNKDIAKRSTDLNSRSHKEQLVNENQREKNSFSP